MPQDKDELLQVLITKYAQMYMKLAYAIGVPYDDVEDIVMEAFWVVLPGGLWREARE